MNKTFWIALLFLVLLPSSVRAEIIVLKDLTAINAKIIEQDEKMIKVDQNGQQVTYYVDQIKSINGEPYSYKSPSKASESEAENAKKAVIPPQGPPKVETSKGPDAKQLSSKGKSKLETIRMFIDLFGTRESMAQNFERMLQSMSLQKSQEIRKILNVDEVIENIVPLYDNHFTQEELDTYITFFSSPQGQKFLRTIPIIMRESIDVNIEYFKAKMPKDAK